MFKKVPLFLAIIFIAYSITGIKIYANEEIERNLLAANEVTNYTEIHTVADLQLMSNNLSGNFKLMCDVDLSDIEWVAVGSSSNPFKGSFDGQGYTIKNLTISNPMSIYQGLFGYAKAANIINTKLENANITSTYNFTGSLLGGGFGGTLIENCSAVGGTVSNTKSNTGGLVGQLNDSRITKSYTSNAVQGNNFVGGLVGHIKQNSMVSDCFSRSFVYGNKNMGGLCYSDTAGVLKNSYFAGSLADGNALSNGVIESSYDDVEQAKVSEPSGLGKL